jgi:para-nitrobenzyl esterase
MFHFDARAVILLLLCSGGFVSACSDQKPLAQPSTDASTEASIEGGTAGHTSSGGAAGVTPDARPDGNGDAGAIRTQVTIDDGVLEGRIVNGNIRSFLGIPYAKPPVGALRWAAPQKNDGWATIKDAGKFGPRCAQLESTVLQNAASNDEDCLYLNVWSPLTAKSKLPVMVWIHGGGNVNGSASEPVPFVKSGFFYSGEFLAQRNVVVVSLNYRLGVFGFFGHPDLAKEGSPLGNQGLLDQQLALEWVKNNVAKFGGDPSNVTIFGESAGSQDVCLHVAAPKSRGLFHRAISESGGCTAHEQVAADAAELTTTLAAKVGCKGDGVLACLRGKSVADLLAAVPTGTTVGQGFGPIVDGDFMPDQPRTLYDAGNIAKVPYILGSNTDEGTLFTVGQPQVASESELTAQLAKNFTPPPAEIEALYPLGATVDGGSPYTDVLARVFGDAVLICTTYDTAVRAAKAGSSVYMYNFDIPVDIPGLNLGATHGSELVYVFGTATNFTAETRKVSDRVQTYWTNFANTGDPNGTDVLAWPKFSQAANVRMNFGPESTIVTDFHANECAFWQKAYEAQFKGSTDAGHD